MERKLKGSYREVKSTNVMQFPGGKSIVPLTSERSDNFFNSFNSFITYNYHVIIHVIVSLLQFLTPHVFPRRQLDGVAVQEEGVGQA